MLLSHLIRTSLLIFFVLKIVESALLRESAKYTERRPRVRCSIPDLLPNGNYNLGRNKMVLRVSCVQGYTLQGSRVVDCVHGKWFGEKPVCAKKGCTGKLENPPNGIVQIENNFKAILFCGDNYSLAGNRFAYCNGTNWDRSIGSCRLRNNTVQHECDFETDDICGWVYEQKDNFEWKRVMAANIFSSFQTGPRHDHTSGTANGGHYMLMENLGRIPTPVALMSPIYERALSLKTACCFRFYYFMYGVGVGDLLVLIKPVSVKVEDLWNQKQNYLKFIKSGNQNNLWNEAQFSIDEMDEDFQVVFIAVGGTSHLGDIAIDDVKLMIGEDCKPKTKSDDDDNSDESEESDVFTTTMEALYDTQSCVSRCQESNGTGVIRKNGRLFGLCNCHIGCEDDDSCCPDFRAVCLEAIFFESTTVESATPLLNDQVLTTVLAQTTLATTTPVLLTTSSSTTTKQITTKTTPRTTKTTQTTKRTTTATRRTTRTTSTTFRTTKTTTKKTTTTTPKTTTTTNPTSIIIKSPPIYDQPIWMLPEIHLPSKRNISREDDHDENNSTYTFINTTQYSTPRSLSLYIIGPVIGLLLIIVIRISCFISNWRRERAARIEVGDVAYDKDNDAGVVIVDSTINQGARNGSKPFSEYFTRKPHSIHCSDDMETPLCEED